jgi:RNA polymerase sigma factor (sigma-70 family)
MNSVQSAIEYSTLICPHNIQVEPFRKSRLEIVDPSDINGLLTKIAEGNHAAFTIIYYRYAPLMTRYLIHFGCTNEHLQEDILQEVFLILWSKREKWVGVTNFDSYLYIMVRNMHRDEIRKTNRLTRIVKQSFPPEEIDNSSIETIDRRERKKIFYAGTNLLPRQAKTVCELTEQGVKIKEIARVLVISPQTVRNHRQVAIKKLKQWLAQHIN